jgi:hypothetical protein
MELPGATDRALRKASRALIQSDWSCPQDLGDPDRRVLALENDFDALPPEIQKYLSLTSENHSYIFGDFVICPLEPDRPGHMRRVCVTGAEKLVIQSLRRSARAFRLVSTWPTQHVGSQRPK